METNEKKPSLRLLAKQLGISHTTLSKIATGNYKANPQNIFKKLLDNIQGAMIPSSKYDEILQMLNDASFPKFGDTSRTASWLYELIAEAKKGYVNKGGKVE